MNIDFERDNYKFNVRASAIILNEKRSDNMILYKSYNWEVVFVD